MTINAQSLKAAGICSLLSALTTAVLMYGPDAPAAENFDATQALHTNALHLYKKWVLFFHSQFHLIAAFGAAALLYRQAPFLTGLGLFYLTIWAVTEMTQQAFLIDALNQIWRPAYLAAGEAGKIQWRTIIEGHNATNDTLYFVLIYGFAVGSVLFGLALCHHDKMARLLGVVISLIGITSLSAFTYYYAGASWLGPLVDSWYDWLYGPLQIGARAGLCFWLWRQANQQNLPVR